MSRHFVFFYLTAMQFFVGCADNPAGTGSSACRTQPLAALSAGTLLHDPASSARGMAFTTVDAGYSSSRLFWNDFDTGEVKTLLSGESGDPAVMHTAAGLFFFNRRDDNLNIRWVDPVTGTAGAQTALAGVRGGDPHAALMLDNEHLLLALNVTGKLALYNIRTCEPPEILAFDFDTGDGAGDQFRPESFVKSADRIYILHQGLDSAYAANGTQQVFAVRATGQQAAPLEPVDFDPGSPRIQGIRLHVTNPGHLRLEADGSLLAWGLCTAWDSNTCVAGFDRIEPVAGTSSLVTDLTAAGYDGNGAMIPGPGDTWYALMSKGTGSGGPDMHVTAINRLDGSIAIIHTFPTGSSGCCALFYDDSTATLLVGDSKAGADGLFTTYQPSSPAGAVYSIHGHPYGAAFVPR